VSDIKTQLLIGQAAEIVEKVASIQNGWQALVICVAIICLAWVFATLFKNL
jgi:hypothetical protein